MNCASLLVQIITAASLLGVGEPIRSGSLSDTAGSTGEGDGSEEEEWGAGTGPPSSSQVTFWGLSVTRIFAHDLCR